MQKMLKPLDLGYRMPAEWEQHAGTLISWPCNTETWPEERLERVEHVYLQIIHHLRKSETVHLIVSNQHVFDRAQKLISTSLGDINGIVFHLKPGNDVWARDFGPIFIKKHNNTSQEFAITNWGYNAWGGKYPPFDADNAVPGWFAENYDLRIFTPGIILEGGSIETNGKGVMLTTESVLLNPNRNPHLNKSQIENYLKDYLGQDKIIWLKNGLAGDDTDGHIDDLSRFLDERTIMTMITDDHTDINYAPLQENLEILKAATDQNGKPFEIVTVPMPVTKIEGTTVDGSEHVPASYANFYFSNKAILLPVYDPKYDSSVVELFKKYCPDREIIPIPCADLVWGQGSIHCITQQLYGI